ncbi:sulfotransferase family protein [Mangrovihabitans endophyticus]|uniref:Sulfotransferase family protein n=1 Tax=Mangrovihabitans endophyticus TaxID=1751298 RepID=A0A8J3FKQ6_9ACTN|nr:sulfotransferase [Mangrovihabitans endophyticus]GGK72425.1 sulfotransferase family protein [Mangrovihabitans endophyticus]
MIVAAERLVPSPVFILSSIRSGSTLLRCLLNSHTQIHAPHELHLVDLSVRLDSEFSQLAMRVAGLDGRQLEHLLWDRVLHRELVRSGKQVIVDKTPANALRWKRVAECWPDARYLFLLRHPVRILESAILARPHATPTESAELVRLFLTRLIEAREENQGCTVRYEDLARDPTVITKKICDWLDVRWEPQMINYGSRDHGPFLPGIGDFTQRIRVGRVLPGRPDPGSAEVPEELRTFCQSLGYL